MNNLTDNEFESEKERAWQEYQKLAYTSKSEYKAFLHGANLAKQHNARLTSELSDLKERLHKADGMANEINILVKENRRLTPELSDYRALEDAAKDARRDVNAAVEWHIDDPKCKACKIADALDAAISSVEKNKS